MAKRTAPPRGGSGDDIGSAQAADTAAQRFFQLAYSLQMAGNFEEAIALYRRSIELAPSAQACTFLGWALSFQGQYRQAIDHCKKAIELDPGYGNPWNDIGAYLIELGRADEAIPYLQQALECPRYESACYAHFNLYRAHQSRNELGQARECLQRALAANPDYQPAREALGKLTRGLN